MSVCDLLPDLIECDDFSKYNEYRDRIYQVFLDTFINSSVVYDNCLVTVNRSPDNDGYPKGFDHITGRDYAKNKTRFPDFRRSERIGWIKPMIEESTDICPKCSECDGIKIWTRPYKNKTRTIFLSEEESYVVILEKKKHLYMLITAFYIDDDNEMNDFINSYEQYKN